MSNGLQQASPGHEDKLMPRGEGPCIQATCASSILQVCVQVVMTTGLKHLDNGLIPALKGQMSPAKKLPASNSHPTTPYASQLAGADAGWPASLSHRPSHHCRLPDAFGQQVCLRERRHAHCDSQCTSLQLSGPARWWEAQSNLEM